MKAALFVLTLGLPTSLADKAAKNPLGEVVTLLDSLTAKITQEGEDELKAYKAYVEWCDDYSKNRNFEITTATAKKQKLEAEISQLTGDIEASTGRIGDLAGSIATDEKDLKDATVIHKKEADDFAADDADLSDSINTLSR